MDIVKIGNWISGASGATLLAFALVSGQMGWWVFGSSYADMKSERDQWRDIALRASHLAGSSLTGSAPPAPAQVDAVRTEISRLENKQR